MMNGLIRVDVAYYQGAEMPIQCEELPKSVILVKDVN
jgi:hypothetical protein